MKYYDPSAKTIPALRYKYIANVFRLMLIGQKTLLAVFMNEMKPNNSLHRSH